MIIGQILTTAVAAIAIQAVLPSIWSGFQIVGGNHADSSLLSSTGAQNAVVLGVILLAIVAWQKTKKQSRGIWKSYPIMQYKFTTEIDADGIKSTCDIATSLRRWECFTGYFESANLFHIQEGSRVLWIPKRAFAGEAEINQMRELLRSKLNCTTA